MCLVEMITSVLKANILIYFLEYGKEGTGWLKNPKEVAYNKIYNKTSLASLILLSKIRPPAHLSE